MGNELMIQERQIVALNEKLKKFKEMDAIVVGNETYVEIPPPTGFIYSWEVVNICNDPRFGEVYIQKGGKLSLTSPALRKLGKAMGIRFGPGEVVERRWDEASVLVSVIFRSHACVRGLDGQYSWSQMDYEFDVTKRRTECVNTQRKNIKYWMSGAPGASAKAPPEFKACRNETEVEAWINEVVRLEMVQIEKNALVRAQTGSQLRCIRDLGNFHGTYMPEQLEKPFLVPKLVVYFDPINPLDRAFALEQTKVPMMMFPQEPAKIPAPLPTPQIAAIEAQAPPPDVLPPIPARAELNLPNQEELREIDEAMEPSYTETSITDQEMQLSPIETAMLDFEACDASDKIRTVQEQIKKKEWSGKLTKNIDNFTPNELKNFYMMLLKIIKPEPAQSALPWSD